MAPKKPTPFELQPRADSSSDDEEEVSNEVDEEEVSEESEEEEPSEEDGSDEEVTTVAPMKPVVVQSPKVGAKSKQKQPDSAPASKKLKKVADVEDKRVAEEDEEEVSEESEEEEPNKPDSSSEEDGSDEEVTTVAPMKPVVVQSPKVGAKSKQKQPDSAPATAPASAVTVAKLGKKRLGESKADGKHSKKLKVVDMEEVKKDPKKQLFLRLFSEEDEIAMLKALLDYSANKCVDPIEDFNNFYDIVKKSIKVEVTRAQLADKIRRMRNKYENNASKTKEGVDKTFGKLHEQLCYDLSKKIWGKAASASGKGKRIPKPNVTPDQKDKPNVNSSTLFCLSELAKTKDAVGMMGLSDDIFKKAFELLTDEARASLEEKWKNVATAELELYDKRLELSREQVKLYLDALKTSGHRG